MSRYAKALVAFFTTAGGAAATVFADGNAEVGESIVAICGVLAATFGVYVIPNSNMTTMTTTYETPTGAPRPLP